MMNLFLRCARGGGAGRHGEHGRGQGRDGGRQRRSDHAGLSRRAQDAATQCQRQRYRIMIKLSRDLDSTLQMVDSIFGCALIFILIGHLLLQPEFSAHIVVDDALVMLKPIRLFLQRPAHSHPLLVELRFQHLFAGCALYFADLPPVALPSHGTSLTGQRVRSKAASTSSSSASSSTSSGGAPTRMVEMVSAGLIRELNTLRQSLQLNSFIHDFQLRQFASILSVSCSRNQIFF